MPGFLLRCGAGRLNMKNRKNSTPKASGPQRAGPIQGGSVLHQMLEMLANAVARQIASTSRIPDPNGVVEKRPLDRMPRKHRDS